MRLKSERVTEGGLKSSRKSAFLGEGKKNPDIVIKRQIQSTFKIKVAQGFIQKKKRKEKKERKKSLQNNLLKCGTFLYIHIISL